MITDDLIREALQRGAELAVDPERIRSALPARAAARRVRQWRYGVLSAAAIAVAVAVAVAVPVLALRGTRAGPGPDSAASAAISTAPSGAVPSVAASPEPGVIRVPLRYSPSWLPPGLTERRRDVPIPSISDGPNGDHRTIDRTWSSVPFGAPSYFIPEMATPVLSLSVHDLGGVPTTPNPGDTVVDINGAQGWFQPVAKFTEDPTGPTLTWRPDPQTVLVLMEAGLRLESADMLRVARSVQPDGRQVEVPLRLSHLPAAIRLMSAACAGNSRTAWQCTVNAGRSSDGPGRNVDIALGTGTEAPQGGEATTVAGRPARFVTRDTYPIPGKLETDVYLVVDLGEGLLLTLTDSGLAEVGPAPYTRTELVHLAEGIEVGPAEVSWLGARPV